MSEEKNIDFPQGIDFNRVILDINGKPFKDGEQQELRLGEVCCMALLATIPGDKADGGQKLKRFGLAQKIKGSAEEDDFPQIHLNSTQKKMIEDLVAQVYATTIYARVYEALEGRLEDA